MKNLDINLFKLVKRNSYLLIILAITITSFNTSAEGGKIVQAINDEQLQSPQKLSTLLSSQRYTELGETTFSILFWDLYKSKLLTTSGKYPITHAEESLVFHINYLADISSQDLIMRTVEQWQHLGLKEAEYDRFIQPLTTLWPNIASGDSLALLVEDNKSAFYFNDQYIGVIDDPNFGQLFIDIWLSTNTSQPGLRAELLGDNSYE